jgi:DNA-binding GntR family transcriptional regulator
VTVEPESPDPLFEQLAEVYRERIASGDLGPRQKLLTQDQIAERYDVSRGTVLRATRLLVKEGLLRFSPGKGLYVANPDVIEPWIRAREAER